MDFRRERRTRLTHHAQDIFQQRIFRQGAAENLQMAGNTVLSIEGILNGGICGALLDCHSNWTAAYHLMKASGASTPPCTVTADFHVTLKRPTPMDVPLTLRAKVVESLADRAVVEATLEAGGRVTALCRGTFVAVKEGHPAYHRW